MTECLVELIISEITGNSFILQYVWNALASNIMLAVRRIYSLQLGVILTFTLVLIHLSGESHNGQIDRECFYKTNSERVRMNVRQKFFFPDLSLQLAINPWKGKRCLEARWMELSVSEQVVVRLRASLPSFSCAEISEVMSLVLLFVSPCACVSTPGCCFWFILKSPHIQRTVKNIFFVIL